MKLKIVLFCSVIVMVAIGLVLYIAPYALYKNVLVNGMSNEYINLVGTQDIQTPTFYERTDSEQNVREDDNLWKTFHFADYIVPLPVRHPVFYMVPLLEYRPGISKKPEIGFSFVDTEGNTLYTFIEKNMTKFSNHFESAGLFRFPIIQKIINDKSHTQIWTDIFQLDLGRNIGLGELRKFEIKELVYRLYILHMRTIIFSGMNLKSFTMHKGVAIGITDERIERRRKELLFFLRAGYIHTVEVTIYTSDINGKYAAFKVLDEIQYKLTDGEKVDEIYSEFQGLDYKEKVSHTGMTYLMAAWSHRPYEENFLKQIIRYLERGKGNESQLNAMYEYAYEKFGTTFSLVDLRETEDAKLKRKIEEEIEREREEVKDTKLKVEDMTPEQEQDYYLEKAKEMKSFEESSSDQMSID